ncbi:PREDICTED: peroxisomal membrane protein PEX16-like [Cyphomyrmex costatus]|uniref:Peroxisomal membrane protein PEX16 n=1 Tax=Cyphomyrmex costatus TaxID=456900 RepID=A0A195CWC1_9HYME|nr:PREDICTED: peroxisomal membrane protein PEX16-like [Cyphomyrmex costatus]KYN04454.1 Peroxisomal membrane protein PEX16 [Cyphomyrmex costatus]
MAKCVNSTLNNLLTSYKNWIVTNPQLLTDIEATVRCLSYFSFGQLRNSTLAVELIYSMPNLIVLCNDLLMYSSKRQNLKIPQFDSKIKIWLTVVEYTETLLEVSAKKLWGPKGKWLIIVVIQLFKSILRLLLIYVYKERITKSPAIPPLNREKFNKIDNVQLKEGFMLKRSGTVVRSVKYSTPIELRTWKALPSVTDENENLTKNQESNRDLKLAESLYVTKPLLHLGCIYLNSKNRWPPWILSLIIDIASLNVFARCARKALLSKDEEEELVRRRLSLLLYILRSPFYDKYSRNKIDALLDTISNSVPLAKYLTSAVKKNLPYMQNCDCYPGTRCPSGTTGGLDPRIVNSGTTCSTGYVACCTTGSSNSGCGVSKVPPGAHPVGQAAYGAYPWMVAILDENSNYIGAGALITARHVLTASHKVAPYDPDEIIAALGMWSFQQNPYDPTILPISKIAIHPYYDLTNFHYDVAVLKLGAAAPITSAPNVNTVCLPSAVVGAGRKCWVTGWGKNTFNGNEQSTLKEVDVSVVSHANCQNALRQTRLGANFILDDSFMCAGGIGGKDACTGDGGSPLVCQSSNGQYSVFGIVSWGIGCANQGVPGVYADVISSLGWIQQNLT